MLITEAASRETPTDDDEISVVYAKPPSDDKGKGKAIEIDHRVDDDDDDEIQLLFATTWNHRKKKRKSFIDDDDDVVVLATSSSMKGVQETLVEEDQLKVKKKLMVDLNNSIDFVDDDDVQVIYSFPKIYHGEISNSTHDNDENCNLSMKVGADDDNGDLSLVMCEICADEKPKRNFVTVMGCDHSYCSECVSRYVASRLQENVVEITCPVSTCEGVLGPEHCRSILPSEVYDRWGTALCEEIISPSQKFYCPYKDCSALMIDDTQETGEVIMQMECPNCQRMFCVKCKVPWHSGVECEEFQMLNEDERGQEDIMLVNLAKKNLWKRCPRCKMYVQRSQGCNTMRCRCGCSFCYACGAAFPLCICMQGFAQHLPIGDLPDEINRARQIQRALFSVPVNQTRAGPVEVHPNAFLQDILSTQRQLQMQQFLSTNHTHFGPSIQFPQGPVGGSGDTAVGGSGDTVGVDGNTPNARQGPVEVHSNGLLRGHSIAHRQLRMQMQLQLLNPSANQTHMDPSIQVPTHVPVGGWGDTPNARQGLVGGGSNTPNVRQGPDGGGFNTSTLRQVRLQRLRMMNGLRNRRANQTQSNPSSQFQQGPVGGHGNAPNAMQLEQRPLQMMYAFQSPSAEQTRSYTNIPPPLGASVSRTNDFIHVDPVENLSPNQTPPYTNMPFLFASVDSTNEFIQPSQSLPGTSQFDPIGNSSASET